MRQGLSPRPRKVTARQSKFILDGKFHADTESVNTCLYPVPDTQVVCSVDGLEAEYEFLPQTGTNKKCLITLRSSKHKLDLKKAFGGDGYAQYLLTNAPVSGRTNRWEARTTLEKETRVRSSSTQFGAGGESMQITLGEQSQLFPCSGFVRGNLEGTIKAPALHLKMMGKDVWAFFLYFDDGLAGRYEGYRIRCEKDSLAVAHGSTSAIAAIDAVDERPPGIRASLRSNGSDFKHIRLILDRAIGKGSLQDSIQQELVVLAGGEDGNREASWAPVNRGGSEVLWIFSSESLSQRGPLNELLQALGATVNRSAVAGLRDYVGGREMDDFIIADDPSMAYQVGLVLEDGSGLDINDWAGLGFVKNLP